MTCADIRTAISALADGEVPSVPEAAVDAHLLACTGCSGHADDLRRLEVAVVAANHDAPQDHSAVILHAIDADDLAHRTRPLRAVLLLTGVLQVVAALVAFADAGLGASHVLRDLAAFDLAIGVGFVTAAVRPARTLGLLPVVATLVATISVVKALEAVTLGTTDLVAPTHLFALAGLALTWQLARPLQGHAAGSGRTQVPA